MGENGWEEYQKLVLTKLEEHSAGVASLSADLCEIKVEIATLKVKASLWGAGAGLVISAIVSSLIVAAIGG